MLGRRSLGEIVGRLRGGARITASTVLGRGSAAVADQRWASERGLRLHLGCGRVLLRGYVNVDIDPSKRPDLCMDFRQIRAAFEPGSAREVLMIHSLGYLRLWEARRLFADVHALLEPGGMFVAELPDVGKCAGMIVEAAESLDDYMEAVRGIYAFGIGEVEWEAAYTPYAFGWSGWHLTLELEKAGFGRVEVLDPQTHGRRRSRDIRVEALK